MRACYLLEIDRGDFRSAGPDRASGRVPLPLFQPGNQLVKSIGSECLSCHDLLRGLGEQRDRCEILHNVVAELVAYGIEDVRLPVADTGGVTVGRSMGNAARRYFPPHLTHLP